MRSYCTLLGCTLWIFLLGSCQGLGDYVEEIGNLEVISPGSLRGSYESSVGRFGIPEHEGALAGEVVYTMANQRGCHAFDSYGMSFRREAGSLPAILLIERGDCFFSLKVFNAQKAGAAAVLIMDDRIEPLIFMDTPEEVGWQDYHQQKIDIPSALISKSFGDQIKEALSRRELVIINLAFNYPNEVASTPREPVKPDICPKVIPEDASESRKEDIGTWNWSISSPSGRLEMEDTADTDDDRISDQDEPIDTVHVEGKDVNQIIMSNKYHFKDSGHEKGSDLVRSDTEGRLRRSESATKYILGRWNPGKINNPEGGQVWILSGNAAECRK